MIKNFYEYIELASRTDKMDSDKSYYILQLLNEVLELTTCKDNENVKKEIGDIMWYIFAIVRHFNIDPDFLIKAALFDFSDKNTSKSFDINKNISVIMNELQDHYKEWIMFDAGDSCYQRASRLHYYMHLNALTLSNLFVKNKYHGHQFDETKFSNYLWKLFKSVCFYCILFSLDLGDVMDYNISKLAKRYPEGYSDYMSINREG